jgi:predicted transposase/invertase (TIGR01784 family)
VDHAKKPDNEGITENVNPEAGKSPHDEFFTYVFSDTTNVRDFLRISLPVPVLQLLDLGSLTVSKETFVDEELRRSQSDILIQTGLAGNREPVLIYILIEHKSYPDRWTLLQLLKYMVKIWEKKKRNTPKGLKTKSEALPVIIPMIFYHGKNRWRYPIRFSEYFKVPPDMHSYVPDFTADFIDVRDITISRAFANSRFRAAVLAFQYSPRELGKHVWEILLTAAGSSHDPRFEDFLTALLRYILLVLKGGYEEEVRKAVKAINMREVEEAYMTIAEKLKKEGIEEGLEKGIEEGKIQEKQQVLIRLLSKKYSLNEQDKQHISSISDPDKLDLALDEIVVAETKEQVLKLLE